MQRDSYAVTAEFYDVLQAEQDEVRVRELYGEDVERARVGVLDVGAGTGRVALMGLMESQVPVHAIEPNLSMRSSLMTRLATLPRNERARITVHPRTLGEAALHGVADVAICHNTVACLEPASRRALWPALAEALVPGGVLVIQLPPALVPPRRIKRVLPTQRVGQHEYGGHVVMSPAINRIRTRFHYWVRSEEGVVREHDEAFWMWPSSRDQLIVELEGSGFVALPERADPAVLALELRQR
ncbi:class I SAM-dependent methyltransferase [Streptomyces sp. NPDC060187]|uniref:class I SAM-dependent methyltransferase n=1 Tax=Streptomyces sp. NPDC060187 TaxID=3347067 RepID=UPI00364E7842